MYTTYYVPTCVLLLHIGPMLDIAYIVQYREFLVKINETDWNALLLQFHLHLGKDKQKEGCWSWSWEVKKPQFSFFSSFYSSLCKSVNIYLFTRHPAEQSLLLSCVLPYFYNIFYSRPYMCSGQVVHVHFKRMVSIYILVLCKTIDSSWGSTKHQYQKSK